MTRRWAKVWAGCVVLLIACTAQDGRTSGSFSSSISASASDSGIGTGGLTSDDDDDGPGSGGGTDGSDPTGADSGIKLDVYGGETEGVTAEGSGPSECSTPEHVPCDGATADPFEAIGLGCPGELQVDDSTNGPATAIGVRSSFGATGVFDPREGSVYAVLGSGLVADLDLETPPGDEDFAPLHCNDDLGPEYDPGETLPLPLRPLDVAGDCTADASLIGTGDCSSTVQAQFEQGLLAEDYVEMRFELDVPEDIISFSYDFAFMSTEYPEYFGSPFNDMYVGWLESEGWTGNISFDGAGNPISLNAGFLDYKDDGGGLAELAGTCMRQHAATGWLTTTAGVTPGEHITVVFAIFDLSDSRLDSYVFLDNWQWGCEPVDEPETVPEG